MKAVAIAMAAVIGLFFVSSKSVQAYTQHAYYCKSGQAVKDIKHCKENGGHQ